MNGWTETQEQINERWARWKMGGYSWFPKTEDEREQVRLMQSITAKDQDAYFYQLFGEMERERQAAQIERDNEWLANQPIAAQVDAAYGQAEFGSKEWFDTIEPIEF